MDYCTFMQNSGPSGIYVPGATSTVGRLEEEQGLDLVLHVGDLSYAVGHGYIWEQWMNLISPVAMKVPYMVSVGNHEYDHERASTSPDGKDPSGLFIWFVSEKRGSRVLVTYQ